MIVTLLTDYGRDDDFVGVCHGVIRSIHPEADIVDITHGIERYAVRHGALVLRNTLPYMPVGVHVAVVDPQVGTERRAVALRTGDGRLLVGPDNGLLSLAWERCEGVDQVVDITRSPHRLEPVSATFHGRDIFAPVGAALERATYVTFTSSSTVRFLLESAARPPEGARIVSIGPVTSATAQEHGLSVHVEAERHDVDGLVEALRTDAAERRVPA